METWKKIYLPLIQKALRFFYRLTVTQWVFSVVHDNMFLEFFKDELDPTTVLVFFTKILK